MRLESRVNDGAHENREKETFQCNDDIRAQFARPKRGILHSRARGFRHSSKTPLCLCCSTSGTPKNWV